MENASIRLQYKVGIFVAVGLIIIAGSILALGGNRVVFTKYQIVRARFTQVQGLFTGSVVSLSGLPVGNVKRIYFVPGEGMLEVEMQVDKEFSDRLRQGTTAEIRTQGALGDKFVYLTPGPPTGEPLADGAMIEAIDDTDFLKLLTSKEDGIGRVLDLIKEMHKMVASMNANNRVADTSENLKHATAQLRITLAKIDQQLPENQKLRQAVNHLASVAEKIDSGKGTLGALINDPSVHQSLKALLGGSPRNKYMKEMVRESVQQADSKK